MSDDNGYSLFARRFSIPSIKSDLVRWNKEWEKALPTLSAADDVFRTLSPLWDPESWEPSELSDQAQKFKDRLCGLQKKLVELWDEVGETGHFATAWMLLDEAERRRYLLEGLKKACEYASWHQDGRALCPEITLSPMLKRRGKGFIDFISDYTKGTKDVGEDNVYLLPSDWWQKAVDQSEAEPLSDEVVFTFKLMTIQRNEFVCQFTLHTSLLVLRDLSIGSPGMSPVRDMMKADGMFARSMAKMLSGMRDKPLIRCENCAQSSEEAGTNVKFMVCSCCKAKLDFAVHYCSPACQKEDWRRHKKHCGKKKVLKNVKGTVYDPFWANSDFPDYLRPPESTRLSDGGIPISSLGFGTLPPSRTHSPALQQQVALITSDKDADYFIFDEQDQPIRFVIHDMWMKISFRNLRSGAIFSAGQEGLEAMAEYLIKVMADKPGLSRERILDQLSREYGENLPGMLGEWERKRVNNGYEPGSTFVETTSSNMAANTQRIMNL